MEQDSVYRQKYAALGRQYLQLKRRHLILQHRNVAMRRLFTRLQGAFTILRKRYLIALRHAGVAIRSQLEKQDREQYEIVLAADHRIIHVSRSFLETIEMDRTEFGDSFYIDVLFDRYLPRVQAGVNLIQVKPFQFPVMIKDYGDESHHLHPYHYFSISGNLSYSKNQRSWLYRLKAEDISASVELDYFHKTDKLITSLSLANTRLSEAHKNVEMHKIIVMLLACSLIEEHSRETSQHIERMQRITELLAGECRRRGLLRAGDRDIDEYVKDIQYTAVLHDIGKLGVPRSILAKPAKLTPHEFEIIKLHTTRGAGYIKRIIRHLSASPGYASYLGFLDIPYNICMHHHERWDGQGYPAGLAGDAIPLPARIVAVADTYDAIRMHRVYKAARSHQEALDIIHSEEGAQFDPAVVTAFLAIEPLLMDIVY